MKALAPTSLPISSILPFIPHIPWRYTGTAPSVDLLRYQFHREHTMAGNRWIRPEVYPLFAAVGVAVGICGLQLVRNICINPEVRVTKQNRAAGVLENFAEGEKYSEHFVRKYVRNKTPQIMPKINSFFTDPQ